MKHSFRFLGAIVLIFAILNLKSVLSQDLLVAPNGPITLGLGALEDMAFSPDGKYIATLSSQGIFLWDAQTLDLIRTLHSIAGQLYRFENRDFSDWYRCGNSSDSKDSYIDIKELCVKFSQDGNFITNGIEVWDVNEGTIGTFDDVDNWSTTPVNNIYSYSSECLDGKRLDDGTYSPYTCTIEVKNVEGENVATIEPPFTSGFTSSYPISVRFSPDGKTLAILRFTLGGKNHLPLDTSAFLYDLTKGGSSLGILGHHFDWITSLTFGPNNVIATTRWKAIDLWDMNTGKHLHTLGGSHSRWGDRVIFSPNNNVIAIFRWQAIDLWNVSTGQHLYTLDLPIEQRDVYFSVDSSLIKTIGRDGQILIWQVNTGELIFDGKDIDDFDKKSAFNSSSNSKSNKKFFGVSWDRKPDYIYENDSTQYLAKVSLYGGEGHSSEIPHERIVNSVDFSLERDKLVTVGYDGLLLMDTESRTFIGKFPNYNTMLPSINQAVFTLEDKIITFHVDGSVFLWEDINSWESATLLPFKHQRLVFDVTTSSDKRTIVTRNVDGTVTLFPVGYPSDFD